MTRSGETDDHQQAKEQHGRLRESETRTDLAYRASIILSLIAIFERRQVGYLHQSFLLSASDQLPCLFLSFLL